MVKQLTNFVLLLALLSMTGCMARMDINPECEIRNLGNTVCVQGDNLQVFVAQYEETRNGNMVQGSLTYEVSDTENGQACFSVNQNKTIRLTVTRFGKNGQWETVKEVTYQPKRNTDSYANYTEKSMRGGR